MVYNLQQKRYSFFLWIYALSSGAVIAVAFLPLFSKWLIWVALVPFFGLTLFKMNRRRDLFFFGWLSGFAAFGMYLRWFFDAIPLNWLGISSLPLSYGLAALVWFLAAGYGALWFGLFLVLVRAIARTPFQNAVIIIGLWSVLEYLRTASFSLNPFLFGGGHIFGDHISFLLLSYSLAGSEMLRQLASIFGSYGISILVIIPNVLIFSFFGYLFSSDSKLPTRPHQSQLLIAALSLVILYIVFISDLFWIRGHQEMPNNVITIAIAHTKFYPEDWVGNAEGYLKRGKEASRELFLKAFKAEPQPSIIVMPEGIPTALSDAVDKQGTRVRLSEISQKLGAAPYRLVIDSAFSNLISGTHTKNTVALVDNAVGIRGIYEKRFLMPFGEYLPYIFSWGASFFGASSWLARQVGTTSYVPGNSDGVFETPVGKIGILTCSELLSPSLVRQTAKGSSVLIFPASDGIFRGSPLLMAQNLAMAQIRAAEVAKPIIYSSNSGQSFVVDASGQVIWVNTDNSNDISLVRVAANEKITFAMRYEKYLLFIFGIAVLSVVAYNYANKNENLFY